MSTTLSALAGSVQHLRDIAEPLDSAQLRSRGLSERVDHRRRAVPRRIGRGDHAASTRRLPGRARDRRRLRPVRLGRVERQVAGSEGQGCARGRPRAHRPHRVTLRRRARSPAILDGPDHVRLRGVRRHAPQRAHAAHVGRRSRARSAGDARRRRDATRGRPPGDDRALHRKAEWHGARRDACARATHAALHRLARQPTRCRSRREGRRARPTSSFPPRHSSASSTGVSIPITRPRWPDPALLEELRGVFPGV